jgi:hypothetical protein
MAPTRSFTEVVSELLAQQRPACPVCEHPEQAEIEASRASGAPLSLIGRVLQRTGDIPERLTVETAARRVREHFRTHVER